MAADWDRRVKGLRASGPSVILDSNFLFVPKRFNVDIFEEMRRLLGANVRFLVPRPVITELHLLRHRAAPSVTREIDFALSLVERCEVLEEGLLDGELVDDFISRMSSEKGYGVATNDRELRRHLRASGVQVVYLRQRTHLEVEGVQRNS
ncbi:MAG TPA: 30S processome protein Utp24 [Patescibacteria group bacterium]|nr:30S processome protein Utp24 [Patescibacteria group bacterium]